MPRVYIWRCPPAKTCLLAAKGDKVWAPRLKIRRRLPRSRKTVPSVAPALPGYLFSHEEEIPAVLRRAGVRPLALSGVPATVELDVLQTFAESVEGMNRKNAKAALPPVAPSFEHGERVRVLAPLPGLLGKIATVTGRRDEKYFVETEETVAKIEISAFLLRGLPV